MSIIQTLKDWLTGKDHEPPKDVCPNCWGRQEYEGKFFDAVKQQDIDVHNLKDKLGWIQTYAKKNFEGIELQPTDGGLRCKQCDSLYAHYGQEHDHSKND
jgi:hypothetical protein